MAIVFRYMYQKNLGPSASQEFLGIQNAKGKYIAFCDSDDRFLPEKLEKQMEYIPKKHPNCLFLYTWYNQVNHKGNIDKIKTTG